MAGLVGNQAEDPLTKDLYRFHEARIHQDRVAMLTLGAWALGNVGVGLWGDVIREDHGSSAKYFHQMNWMWGIANGAIAGFGGWAAFKDRPQRHLRLETLSEFRTRSVVFLVNGALDVAYIATGAWLWERGTRISDRVFRGYGQSIILQGGFLLAFDGVMYVLSRHLARRASELPVKLVPTGQGVSVVGRF